MDQTNLFKFDIDGSYYAYYFKQISVPGTYQYLAASRKTTRALTVFELMSDQQFTNYKSNMLSSEPFEKPATVQHIKTQNINTESD